MRTLVVNIGNTTLFCGVFAGARLVGRFRIPVEGLRAGRNGNLLAGRVSGRIDRVVLCSVVPALTGKVARAIRGKFGIVPAILKSTSPHGLTIAYRRPAALGADRLACAMAARALYPRRDAIVVDCGTATTVTAVSRKGVILGGAILPGVSLWSEMLAARTAKLPRVGAIRAVKALGRSPEEAIRAGIFHGHAGAIRGLVEVVGKEAFGRATPVVVGTGGHARIFRREKLFTDLQPDLILAGLGTFAARISAHA